MIDALIYGMMPSAKIVTCDRLLAREHVVEAEHRCWPSAGRSSSSAAWFTPGVGDARRRAR